MSELDEYLIELVSTGARIASVRACIEEKLAAQGVLPSRRQLNKLARSICEGQETLEFSYRQRSGEVEIVLTEADLDSITASTQLMCQAQIQKLYDLLPTRLAPSILRTRRRAWRRFESRNVEARFVQFRRRLAARWRIPFDGLGLMVELCVALGETSSVEIHNVLATDCPFLTTAMPLLHARACQIAREIVHLISGGFADGAFARWRTLHEVAVVMLVLSEYKEELAERYILHEGVAAHKLMKEYVDLFQQLGYPPLEPEEIDRVNERYAKLGEMFGKEFCSEYGWASKHLGLKAPTFRDLERAAGTHRYRAHYRFASNNVHANPKGILSQLGLIKGTHLMLAGPSNTGFTDPGHATARSLLQACSAMVLLCPTLDKSIDLEVLRLLVQDIGESLSSVQQKVEEAELDRRGKTTRNIAR